MGNLYREALLTYVGFVVLATALILIRRWVRPNGKPSDVWKKYPIYMLLNISFLVTIWLPHSWHALTLLLTVIGFGASWELCRALTLNTKERIALCVMTACLVIASDWLGTTSFVKLWVSVTLVSIAVGGLGLRSENLGRGTLAIAGCLGYIPWCLAAFIWVWHADVSGLNALFLYGVIATNDAFAQIIGQLVGRHLLAPHISPGKTLEGAMGGIVTAGLVGAFTSTIIGWSVANGIWIGLLIAAAGLTGDLTASSWKRALGIKDFSNAFGANGGFLDRFDSLLFAAPIFFLIVVRS